MKSLTATERDARNVGMNQYGSAGGGGEGSAENAYQYPLCGKTNMRIR